MTTTITSDIIRATEDLEEALKELGKVERLRADLLATLAKGDVIEAVTVAANLGSPRRMSEFFVLRAIAYLGQENPEK